MKTPWKKNLVAAGIMTMLLAPTGVILAASHNPIGSAINLAKHKTAGANSMPGVNAKAKKVEEGKEKATFKVPADGQVWLYDATDKQVEHSISVHNGNTYSFDVKKSQVYVNGTEGSTVDLTAGHTYRIYFISKADRDAATGGKPDVKTILPHTAKLVDSGKNQALSYKATDAGIVYLWDDSNGELINTFKVKAGQTLTVEPGRNRVMVDNTQVVKDAGLKPDTAYNLFFNLKH